MDFTVQLARADKQIEETRKRIKSMELKIAEAQPSEKSDDKVKEKVGGSPWRTFACISVSPRGRVGSCNLCVCLPLSLCSFWQLESLRRSLSEKLAALVKELEAQLAAREQLVKMM